MFTFRKERKKTLRYPSKLQNNHFILALIKAMNSNQTSESESAMTLLTASSAYLRWWEFLLGIHQSSATKRFTFIRVKELFKHYNCDYDSFITTDGYYGSFTLRGTGNGDGTGNGTGNNGFMYFCYVLFTLHRDRDRDREQERRPLGTIPIFPFPVPFPFLAPVPCSVNEPLVVRNKSQSQSYRVNCP